MDVFVASLLCLAFLVHVACWTMTQKSFLPSRVPTHDCLFLQRNAIGSKIDVVWLCLQSSSDLNVHVPEVSLWAQDSIFHCELLCVFSAPGLLLTSKIMLYLLLGEALSRAQLLGDAAVSDDDTEWWRGLSASLERWVAAVLARPSLTAALSLPALLSCVFLLLFVRT